MNGISERITAANMANIQMLEDLATNVYGGFEDVVWLNLAVSKSSFAEVCRRAQSMLSAKDAQEWATLQSEAFQLPTEEYASHVQQLFSVVFGVHSAFAKSLDTMLAALKHAPYF